MWIDRETGLRQDVAHCLLFPLLDQGNTGLQVATDVSVNRILFNANKKATGVEYTISGTKPAVVKARRLVVLASGALGSPQVLERSGVGDKNLLLKLGIQVISDLPGVGSNYQDHNVIFYPYKSSDGVEETIHGVVSGRLNTRRSLEAKASEPNTQCYRLEWIGLCRKAPSCRGRISPSYVAKCLGGRFQTPTRETPNVNCNDSWLYRRSLCY